MVSDGWLLCRWPGVVALNRTVALWTLCVVGRGVKFLFPGIATLLVLIAKSCRVQQGFCLLRFILKLLEIEVKLIPTLTGIRILPLMRTYIVRSCAFTSNEWSMAWPHGLLCRVTLHRLNIWLWTFARLSEVPQVTRVLVLVRQWFLLLSKERAVLWLFLAIWHNLLRLNFYRWQVWKDVVVDADIRRALLGLRAT